MEKKGGDQGTVKKNRRFRDTSKTWKAKNKTTSPYDASRDSGGRKKKEKKKSRGRDQLGKVEEKLAENLIGTMVFWLPLTQRGRNRKSPTP